MVRFIILSGFAEYTSEVAIYIPIWLDLLLIVEGYTSPEEIHLHSNMVRFIIILNCYYSNSAE